MAVPSLRHAPSLPTRAPLRPGLLPLCALLLTIPFCASLTAHLIGPRPNPVPEAAARPSLAFEQYLVDLGAVPPSEEVSARFRFRNMGKLPVTIVETEPSCGCIKPRISRKTLKPNDGSEILLRVRTASVDPGAKEYSLKVHYQQEVAAGQPKPAPQSVDLAFRVKLPAKQVLIQPRALIFYQLGDQPSEQELTVLDQRKTGLKILKAESSLPLAQVSLGTSSDTDEGAHVSRLRVKVAGHVEGRHQGIIKLETDDPIYRRLTVPLIIEGPRSAQEVGTSRPVKNTLRKVTISPKPVELERTAAVPQPGAARH